MKKISIILISILIFCACTSNKKKGNTISISGAFAIYPLTVKWSEVYREQNTDMRFNISAGGAGKGMADVLSGSVDIGMFSREIELEEIEKGAWWVGLCKDAVLPTISANNPWIGELQKRGITRDEFISIFIEKKITRWEQLLSCQDNKNIEVYTRSDACGAAGTFAKYLGTRQENISGVGIHGDPGLAEAVGKDIYGIGYNNTAYIYNIKTGKKYPGIEVIPIDINNNGKIDAEEEFYDTFGKVLDAISRGKYPSPPARELYFISNGKPTKESVIKFMNWCLTDGQKYIEEAGYVPLTEEKLNSYLQKIQ